MKTSGKILSCIWGILWRLLVLGLFLLTLAFVVTTQLPVCRATKIGAIAAAVPVILFLAIPNSLWQGKLKKQEGLRIGLLTLVLLFSLPVPLCMALYHSISDSRYLPVDTGFFSGDFCAQRRALVISPHQDDETGIAGPMIEALTQAGSQVYVVYFSSGDFEDLADLRQQEAAAAMEAAGVPRDHVLFLGYGDLWQGEHIYNAAPDQTVTSYNGRTQTYGTEEFPDFATLYRGAPSPYTRASAIQDMKDCIRYVNPDIIFCADYDGHPEHRTTSMFFEEALGQLLAEEPDYHPQVFKSLSYLTAWDAPYDFYSIPLLQTQEIHTEPCSLGTPSYRWQDRVRFPVPNQFLTYRILDNEYRKLYGCHVSQGAIYRAPCAANSDIVFFERNTDSLLYRARLIPSSGDADCLRDFKLFDTSDIGSDRYDRGLWQPTDEQKTLRCEFPEPVSLNHVSLWEDPAGDQNILEARLLFSDGTSLTLPALAPDGTETALEFPQKDGILWAELQLIRYEGQPGLTELELSCREPRKTAFIKLTDSTGNFLYNAPAPVKTPISLSLYSWPALPEDSSFTAVLTDEKGNILETVHDPESGEISLPRRGTYRLQVSCDQDPALRDECLLYTGSHPLYRYLLPHFEEDYLMFLHYLQVYAYRLGIRP